MLKISTGLHGNRSPFFTQTFHSNFTALTQSYTSCYLWVREQIKLKRAERCQFKKIENYMHFNFVKRQLWHQMMPIFKFNGIWFKPYTKERRIFPLYWVAWSNWNYMRTYIYFCPLFGIWIKLIHGSNCMTSKWQQVSSWCCVCTLVPSQVTERFNSIGPLPMKPEETSWAISIYPYVCLSLSPLRTFLYDVKKGDFDIHVCMLIKFLVNQF